MKIALFSTHVMYTRHFETELEIMQSHLEGPDSDRNEVHVFVCDRQMLCCDVLTAHRTQARTTLLAEAKEALCARCVKARKKGVSLIDGAWIERPIISSPLPTERFRYDSLDELRKIQVDNFLLGQCVASSLISALRNVDVDVHTLRSVIDDCLVSALQVYYSTKDCLKRDKFDLAYIYNGRFAHTHAIIAACRAVGVEFCTHELGCDRYHYGLFRNSTAHDLPAMVQRIDEQWLNEPDGEKRRRVGTLFYTERTQGVEQGWSSYIKSQKTNLLPKEWDSTKTNLVIYTSSDDELEAVEGNDWKNPIYRNQLDAITSVVTDGRLRRSHNLKLYIRIHPNQAFLGNQVLDRLLSLSSDQVVIVPPESNISSYAMLLACAKVLSFGSTMGIEATYWGKPSIVAGATPYKSHNVTYNPLTHSELIDLVLGDIPPKSRDATLKYGYFLKTFGMRHRYYKPTALMRGTFKGVNLEFYRDSYVRGALKILFPSVRKTELVHRYLRAAQRWAELTKKLRARLRAGLKKT